MHRTIILILLTKNQVKDSLLIVICAKFASVFVIQSEVKNLDDIEVGDTKILHHYVPLNDKY